MDSPYKQVQMALERFNFKKLASIGYKNQSYFELKHTKCSERFVSQKGAKTKTLVQCIIQNRTGKSITFLNLKLSRITYIK